MASLPPISTKLAHYPSLQGQRVFITGGGTGIGAAMVEAFAQQGAQVAFVDFAEAESLALVEKIAAAGHVKPWFCQCDVRDVAALAEEVDILLRSPQRLEAMGRAALENSKPLAADEVARLVMDLPAHQVQ